MNKKIRKDITEVVEQKLCHSCGACFASCGHDSINYHETVGGYLFPRINTDSCMHCGLCYDVCPGDHFTEKLKSKTFNDPFVGEILSAKVGRATDKDIFLNSQSGGVVTGILKSLLESKKISVAIATSMNTTGLPRSEAIIVRTKKELMLTQKSKYAPTSILSLIPELLKIDGEIALVGLPCHIHGLENFIKVHKKLKDKIIKIGLICDRVMTNAAIDFLSQKATHDSIDDIVFRDKYHTSYPGDITVKEKNGNMHILPAYNRMIMKDFFTPARCLLCFDKMNIYADIVVGDPHGVSRVDRKNGESLVLVRTAKGQEMLGAAVEANDILVRDASVTEAIKGQDIRGKRRKWSANYSAWNKLGYNLPDYPEEVLESIVKVTDSELKKAKARIEQALSLDNYSSKEELLKSADRYFKKKKLQYHIFKPLNVAKQIVKKLIEVFKYEN